MPQFESTPTLSVKYYASGTYTYNELTLIDALPDASQIEVIWDVNTVYSGPGNAAPSFAVDDLPDSIQSTIKTLVLTSQYTIDAETNTVTIVPAGIENQAIATASGTYYYPSTFTLSPSQFLEIRRSTDITTQLVTFQPGSRLTADVLNLSSSQIFNALQELTEFGFGGTGGAITDIDLSNNSVTELGDVSFTTGVTGLVQWDSATQSMVNTGSTSGLVPNNEGPSTTDGQVLMSSFVLAGPNATPSFDWEWLTTSEVFTDKTATTSLAVELGTIGTDISTLQNKTSDITRPATPGPTVFGADGISVPSGDIVLQGTSVYDYVSHEPYYWQLPIGDSTDITGTNGIKTLGNQTDFTTQSSFQYASSTAASDFNFTNGTWTAPRDMIVSVSLTWSVSLTSSPGDAQTIGRIFLNGANVGGPIYNYNDTNGFRRSATKTVVFPVSASDTVQLLVQRDGGGDVCRAENAEGCLHEVR